MSIIHIFHSLPQECDVIGSQISHGAPTTHHSQYNFIFSHPKPRIIPCASSTDKHSDTNVQLNQCHGMVNSSRRILQLPAQALHRGFPVPCIWIPVQYLRPILLHFLVGSQLRTWVLKNLYFSPHIIMVIKSRNVRCDRHVARMDEIGNTK